MATLAPECPKCGAARQDADAACAKCGLAARHMAAYAGRHEAVHAVLEAAWQRASAAWDDAAAHDEVLRLAAQHDAYPWAAGRYRPRAGDPVADRQLARIQKAVEITLRATATMRDEPRGRSYRMLVGLLILLAVLTLGGLVYVAKLRDAPTPTPPASTK
jgi:hypothetical protein